MSRSAVFEQALASWVRQRRQRELDHAIEHYYRSLSLAERAEDDRWAALGDDTATRAGTNRLVTLANCFHGGPTSTGSGCRRTRWQASPGARGVADSRNRLATDVIVVPISSLPRRPDPRPAACGRGGLARASMAKCEQVTTVRRDRLVLRALGGAVAGRA
jgi:hypothetical protein